MKEIKNILKNYFIHLKWKAVAVFGLAEERKITVKSFLYRYPFACEYKVYMEVYDPEEKQYTDTDEIFYSVTATEGEYAKFYKRFGNHFISGISPAGADEIWIDIEPNRKEKKTWYDKEYYRKNNSSLYQKSAGNRIFYCRSLDVIRLTKNFQKKVDKKINF